VVGQHPANLQDDTLVGEEGRGRFAQDPVGQLARLVVLDRVQVLYRRHLFILIHDDDDAIVSWSASRISVVPVIRLVTPDDPRVADYRDVPEPELLRARGLFVVEGRLVVERLIEGRRFAIRSLLLSDAAHAALQPAIARLDAEVPIFVCDLEHFTTLTGFNIHRGCLALAERPADAPLDDVLRDARLVVVLDDVTNADNVGGVFRNAAAFGAGAVLLSPSSCDPLYRKAIRTSMAWALRVPFARIEPWPGGLEALRARGFSIVALTPRAPSEPLDEFAVGPRPDRIALVIGAEGRGLTATVEAAADRRVRIPIARDVDSLNVAVATGIALSRLSARATADSP